MTVALFILAYLSIGGFIVGACEPHDDQDLGSFALICVMWLPICASVIAEMIRGRR